MKTWASWRSSLMPSVTAVMVLAGASLALASPPGVRDVVRTARGVVGGGDTGDAGSGGGSGDLQVVDIRAGGETGHRGRGGVEDLEGGPGVTPGCIAAAESGQSALDSATGLAHAIAVVQANCGANLQAMGLANALAHLQQNLGKHEGHVSHAGGNGKGNGAGGSDVHGHSGEHGHVGEPNGGKGGNGGVPKGQSTDPHGKPTDPGNGNGNGGGGGGTEPR